MFKIILTYFIVAGINFFLHYKFLTALSLPFFSPIIFVVTFLLIFLFRFYRITIRHFYFLTFCPVMALFFAFLSPVSSALASFLAVFIFDHFIQKKRWDDALFGASAYLLSISLLPLIKYLPFSSNTNLILYFIIAPFIHPFFFYLHRIFRSFLAFREHLYILLWEQSFIFFYLAFTYFFYNSIKTQSYLEIIFLSLLVLISFKALNEAIKVDKLSLLHKLENYLAGTFSLEVSLRKLFRFLRSHISFSHMKVFVKIGGKLRCIFSDDKKFLNRLFSPDMFEKLTSKNKIYVKDVKEKSDFLSEDTMCFYLKFLKGAQGLEGAIVFESDLRDNFSEDDLERLDMISDLISRIIASYLTIEELPSVSSELKEGTDNIKNYLESLSTFITRIEVSMREVDKVLKNLRDKMHKDFEVLENLATNFEKGSSELKNYSDIVREKRLRLSDMLYPLNEARRSFEELISSFNKLKENILKNISLNERMQGFIEFMQDYASKTRLLSLNAAIEATRLGEEAKGFSIIAEEIGTLAQSVENVIEKLTQEFEISYSTLEEAKSLVEEYSNLLNLRKEKFLNSSEEEEKLFNSLNELLPKIESLPMVFENSINELSDLIKSLGDELEQSDTCNERVEEIETELSKVRENLEKLRKLTKSFEIWEDKILKIAEVFKKGE